MCATTSASESYPRVLVVNHDPFNSQRNNGMTMSNLFRGWPEDRLAQVYLSNIAPEFDVCKRFWELHDDDILMGFFGQALPDRSIPHPASPRDLSPKRVPVPLHRRLGLRGMFRNLGLRYREPLREWLWSAPHAVNSRLLAWVRAFQPDVIYSMLCTTGIMRVTVRLAEYASVPIVPHFTDDWISTQYRDAFMGARMRREMMCWLNRTFARSPRCLVIGTLMAQEYQRRYQITCDPFMNCLEESAFPVSLPRTSSKRPIRFVYIGGLHLNRWKSLLEMGDTLSELARQGTPSEIIIHTYPQTETEYGPRLSANPLIRMGGWVPNEEVPSIVADADCLVHVESFDPTIREYTRYSVSTKIPEYMMAGRCIFAYGPQECASIRYIEESKVGLTVSAQSRSRLRDALALILQSPEVRQECATRGRALALERHEATRQRERFRQVLFDVACAWKARSS